MKKLVLVLIVLMTSLTFAQTADEMKPIACFNEKGEKVAELHPLYLSITLLKTNESVALTYERGLWREDDPKKCQIILRGEGVYLSTYLFDQVSGTVLNEYVSCLE